MLNALQVPTYNMTLCCVINCETMLRCKVLFLLYLNSFLWLSNISLILAQDCKTPGQPCNDNKDCCGGCCIQGVCISTYQNCEEVMHPCIEDYCGPGFECYMYKPGPECLGCELQRDCRPYKDSGVGQF